MNMGEWLGSKKTKDMLATQAMIAGVAVGILWMSGGDPEKAKGLGDAAMPFVGMIAGMGGVKVLGQTHIDGKLAARGEK